MGTTLSTVPMVYNPAFTEAREEKQPSNVHFLEANTSEISLEELASQCVVPTWANQELTISHQDFIHTVHEAASTIFSGETVNEPAIRVPTSSGGGYRPLWARKRANCSNVKRHSSTSGLHSLSPSPPYTKG